MPRARTLALVLVAALGLAALTNPSPERHRETLKAAVAERSPLLGALGAGSVAAFVSTYHSAVVASWTTVGDRTATFGVFGLVFVVA